MNNEEKHLSAREYFLLFEYGRFSIRTLLHTCELIDEYVKSPESERKELQKIVASEEYLDRLVSFMFGCYQALATEDDRSSMINCVTDAMTYGANEYFRHLGKCRHFEYGTTSVKLSVYISAKVAALSDMALHTEWTARGFEFARMMGIEAPEPRAIDQGWYAIAKSLIGKPTTRNWVEVVESIELQTLNYYFNAISESDSKKKITDLEQEVQSLRIKAEKLKHIEECMYPDDGYIYIMTPQSNQRLCKVGKSICPAKRLEEVNREQYCGRNDWYIAKAFKVTNYSLVEGLCHEILKEHKVNIARTGEREAFTLTHEEAHDMIFETAHLFRR